MKKPCASSVSAATQLKTCYSGAHAVFTSAFSISGSLSKSDTVSTWPAPGSAILVSSATLTPSPMPTATPTAWDCCTHTKYSSHQSETGGMPWDTISEYDKVVCPEVAAKYPLGATCQLMSSKLSLTLSSPGASRVTLDNAVTHQCGEDPLFPTSVPTALPAPKPTALPAPQPTAVPAPQPTPKPTPEPTLKPTPKPTFSPSSSPSAAPIPSPSAAPVPAPSAAPIFSPTAKPVAPSPTAKPVSPSAAPVSSPVSSPTAKPVTTAPVPVPTAEVILTTDAATEDSTEGTSSDENDDDDDDGVDAASISIYAMVGVGALLIIAVIVFIVCAARKKRKASWSDVKSFVETEDDAPPPAPIVVIDAHSPLLSDDALDKHADPSTTVNPAVAVDPAPAPAGVETAIALDTKCLEASL